MYSFPYLTVYPIVYQKFLIPQHSMAEQNCSAIEQDIEVAGLYYIYEWF